MSCSIVQGISDHCGVLLDVEWEENSDVTLEKRLIPAYHKTDILGLQNFLRENLQIWANNGSCVEDIWKKLQGYSIREYPTICSA
jgi:hypothetical protein